MEGIITLLEASMKEERRRSLDKNSLYGEIHFYKN
jgi:hypothetical protein